MLHCKKPQANMDITHGRKCQHVAFCTNCDYSSRHFHHVQSVARPRQHYIYHVYVNMDCDNVRRRCSVGTWLHACECNGQILNKLILNCCILSICRRRALHSQTIFQNCKNCWILLSFIWIQTSTMYIIGLIIPGDGSWTFEEFWGNGHYLMAGCILSVVTNMATYSNEF